MACMCLEELFPIEKTGFATGSEWLVCFPIEKSSYDHKISGK
jgi:hypothetical protein